MEVHLHSWNPFALLSNLRSINVEKHRYWKESDANEAQETTCPRHTEIRIHCMREEWKESAKEAPNQSVYRNGRIGIKSVAIDQV